MSYINYAIREFSRLIEHLSMQQWLYVLVIGVIVGFFCLRGFGSRTDY